jgi:3-carboxy-cis,cis-muconate cycloisomerase
MHLVGDDRQAELFSPAQAVESWLAAERALALAIAWASSVEMIPNSA